VGSIPLAHHDDLRVGSDRSQADDVGMAYIIERNDHFYVVAYDGNDPRTGKERRRWHPAGRSRADAEAIAERLSAERQGTRERATSALTVEQFLLEVWLPRRRRELRPSTARRYQCYVEHYITPAVGAHRLAGLRAERLDRMYNDLLAHGGRDGGALSAKTVYDVHVVMRSSLRFAVDRHLVDHNVAADARPPRISTRSRPSAEIWTAQQLASFLTHTAHLRLYPAIHLAATTGMRRGEIAGLRWGDWRVDTHRLSVARSRQSIQGGTVEVPTKTAASRRSIDLDANTEQVLTR
jgi:integrase